MAVAMAAWAWMVTVPVLKTGKSWETKQSEKELTWTVSFLHVRHGICTRIHFPVNPILQMRRLSPSG